MLSLSGPVDRASADFYITVLLCSHKTGPLSGAALPKKAGNREAVELNRSGGVATGY
jgi:hypothetical protein